MKKKSMAIITIALVFLCLFVSCEEEIKSYTVSFDSNGGYDIPSVTVLKGESVTKPEDPSMEGMEFCGWYLNDTPYDFTLPVTSNITLVAKWEHVKHVFNENDICSICNGVRCGEDVVFSYDNDTKTLFLNGRGSTYDYLDDEWNLKDKPWNALLKEGKINHVVIEEGITYIGNIAFGIVDENPNSIISVKLPSTLEGIGMMAFYNCSFSEIVVPENVTRIGGGAFTDCDQLKIVTLPGSFEIDSSDCIFEDASNIEKVFFGGTKYEWIDLEQWPFSDADIFCSDGNIELCLSKDRKLVGSLTPYGRGLSEITISEGVTVIGEEAFKDSKITSIKMPSTLNEIRNNAFKNCKNLVSVTLNENLTTFGYNVFEGCTSLKEITIPSTVTSLATHIFKNCSEELKVTYNGITTELINKLPLCSDVSDKISIICSDGMVEYCTGNNE